uniref:Uncharacterized protein n=1 Tax=Arundo donax TaxID=35708 RepID=A0A0A9AA68_ARUDO
MSNHNYDHNQYVRLSEFWEEKLLSNTVNNK